MLISNNKSVAYCSLWSYCDASHNGRRSSPDRPRVCRRVLNQQRRPEAAAGPNLPPIPSCQFLPPPFASFICSLAVLWSLHPKAPHRNRRLWLQVGPLRWIIIAQQGGKLTQCGFTRIYRLMNTHTYGHWDYKSPKLIHRFQCF